MTRLQALLILAFIWMLASGMDKWLGAALDSQEQQQQQQRGAKK